MDGSIRHDDGARLRPVRAHASPTRLNVKAVQGSCRDPSAKRAMTSGASASIPRLTAIRRRSR